jgi:hypothetical protein
MPVSTDAISYIFWCSNTHQLRLIKWINTSFLDVFFWQGLGSKKVYQINLKLLFIALGTGYV